MARNFHESFAQGEIKPPSERSTGLMFAAIAAIVAIVWRDEPLVLWSAAAASLVLLGLSLLAPPLLQPLSHFWFRLSLLLHKVMSPAVMFIMFAFVIVPFGALMRIWYDPLRGKRDKDLSTYWIDTTAETTAAESMRNQF